MRRESLRVLVVDDNAGDRALIRALLKGMPDYDCETIEADSAFSGLLQLERNGIDCVLLDVRMPAMTGWQAYREIMTRFGKVAVVMMSGFADQTGRLSFSSSSVPDLLYKGNLTTDALVRAITHSIRLREQRAQPGES